MVKIPRPEPSVAPSASMMPDLAGSGWGAPGRATQGLGSAIASLGDAFASLDAEAQKEREFQDKLTLVNWSNSVDMDELATRQNYSGDGTDYTLGRQSYFDGSAAEVLQSVSPESRRQAELYIATKRGGYLTGAQRFEGERRQGALISSIVDTIGLQFSNAAIAAPEDRERAFKAAQEGIDAMINGAPLLSEPQKEALRAKAAEHAENMINESLAEDPNAPLSALPRIEQLLNELDAAPTPSEDDAPEASPQQSNLGAADVAPPQGAGSVAEPLSANLSPTRDFSAGRNRINGRPLPAARVEYGVAHDVSGNRAVGRISDPANTYAYHLTFDDRGFYLQRPLDKTAPHARHNNGKSISISYHGFEGDQLSDAAKANGAKAIRYAEAALGKQIDWRRHPEVQGGKDSREAGWLGDVVALARGEQPAQGPALLAHDEIGQTLPVGGSMAGKTWDDVVTDGGAPRSREWGGPRKGGRHAGIDIEGKTGDPVYALKGGKVLNVREGQGYGKMVDVLAPDGTVHRFGHMSATKVRKGQALAPGATIGAVGDTGNTKGWPHLHLEVFKDEASYKQAHRMSSREGWQLRVDPREYFGSTTQTASAPAPVSQRSLTQYAGLGGAREASVGGSESGTARAPNTIPSAPKLVQEPRPVRVADANGQFVPQAQPTQPPREMPTSSVKTHLRQRLLKKLPAYHRQFEAGVSAAIKQVEDAAAKGYALPTEQFDLINQAVTKTGKADLRIRLDKAVAGLEITHELMHRSPAEVEMIATKARATLVRDGILTATPDQIGRVEGVEALAKTMRKELDDNPIGWGVHTGIIPEVMPITPETLSIDVLVQRAAAGRAVANHYEQPPKFFLPEERLVLKAFLEKGGPNMVRLLGGMYEAFGNDMPWAMKEISKDAPEAATLGWLISSGVEPKTITDVSEAIALRATPEGEKIFKVLTPSQDQARLAAVSVNGKAFLGLPEAEQRAIDLANALYVVRAQRKGLSGEVESWDADLWRQAFNEVLGQTTDPRTDVTYGGLTDQGAAFGSWRNRPGNHGVKAIVPPNIRTDALPDLIDALRITDLVEGGMPGGTPDLGLKMSAAEKQSLARAKEHAKQTGLDDVDRNLVPRATRGAPIDNMGRLITVGAFRRATLVTIGDGRYWMALGNPLSDDPQWIGSHDTPDGRYVLDLKKLEPVLKQRVPDAFKDHGASETFSGLRFSNGTGPEAADTLAPIAAASPAYKPAKRESDNVIDLREKALVPRRERETAGKQTSKPAKGDARRRPGGGGFRPQNHIR